MTATNDALLKGLCVLVTRPHQQADTLCGLIDAAGGRAVRFPALEILAANNLPKAAEILRHPTACQWIIFVSANAVRYARYAFSGRMHVAGETRIAAIGGATAHALAEAGMNSVLTAPPPYNSEALLALPEMHAMKGQRCIIVRGQGGRSLLADTLRARGADVDYAELYRRVKPRSDVSALLKRWRAGGIDAVTVSSGEALKNLVDMMGESGHSLLLATPLVVVSQRIRNNALGLGFKHVMQAERAADSALLEVIMSYAMNHQSTVQNEPN